MSTPPQRRVYGRRRGRPLRPGQAALLESLLPALRVTLPEQGGLDPRALFATPVDEIWLEIGFGSGEHLAAQAAAHPRVGLIGCEVFENGVAKLLAEISRLGLGNIRVLVDDARLLLAALPARSLSRVFILFPDPWPKERHKKRRIVSAETLDALGSLMRDGAELRLATDDAGYACAMREQVAAHADFEGPAERAGEQGARLADWPMTRYEGKALAAGRAPMLLRCRRRDRGA